MLYESPVITAYCVFVCAICGMCMGSFLNCMAWRMTHNESVLHGRSHCTSCGHVLGIRDLVPVLSWLASKGRCRYCGAPVSARYPVTELICGGLYVSVLLRYGLTLEALEIVLFVSVLFVLSLTDLESYIIPNATIVAALAIRALYILLGGVFGIHDARAVAMESLVGGFAVAVPILLLALVMDRVLGRDSLGGGDVKLFFVAGTYFGWQQSIFLVIVSCVLGIISGIVGASRDAAQQEKDDATPDSSTVPHLIPFGPSIAAACWVTMMIGPQVVDWYTRLLGLS